jgi:hypothetical protein
MPTLENRKTIKPLCLALIMLGALGGCQSGTTSALDLQGYPNINVVPEAAAPKLTPQEEFEMLSELNALAASQPQLTPAEQAAYLARQRRLAELAKLAEVNTNVIVSGQ